MQVHGETRSSTIYRRLYSSEESIPEFASCEAGCPGQQCEPDGRPYGPLARKRTGNNAARHISARRKQESEQRRSTQHPGLEDPRLNNSDAKSPIAGSAQLHFQAFAPDAQCGFGGVVAADEMHSVPATHARNENQSDPIAGTRLPHCRRAQPRRELCRGKIVHLKCVSEARQG